MAQTPVLARTNANETPFYVGGFVCAVVTLLLVAAVVLNRGGGSEPEPVSGLALAAGDCADVVVESDATPTYRSTDCTTAHDLQVTGHAEHPDAGRAFPGDTELAVWYHEECNRINADFLGSDVLDTTLTGDFAIPTETEWTAGEYDAACFLTTLSADEELEQSVENAWQDFARPEQVSIARLKEGDCFISDLDDPRTLRSNENVELTDCSGSFNGVFFGRGGLPFPDDATLPDTEELDDASASACASQFEAHFGEVAAGFSYRFWRPSEAAWNRGDRSVLCAVLDDDLIDGPYEPTRYPSFFNLEARMCFNLTPELTAADLTLDGRVTPVDCDAEHIGQKIDIGTLLGGQAYPGDAQVEADAQEACAEMFTDFIGIPPQESEYRRFPLWFPDADTWEAGDRRYGCAILDDEIRTGSLEGVRR